MGITFDEVFGLGVTVEEAGTTSGFKAAEVQPGRGAPLYGDLRIEGWAAMVSIGFAKKLTIVGRAAEAKAIYSILIDDFHIPHRHLDFKISMPSTAGNIDQICTSLKGREMQGKGYALSSSLYHLGRAGVYMNQKFIDAGLPLLPMYPAEAFLLVDNPYRETRLLERFGGDALARRMVDEIAGAARTIREN